MARQRTNSAKAIFFRASSRTVRLERLVNVGYTDGHQVERNRRRDTRLNRREGKQQLQRGDW